MNNQNNSSTGEPVNQAPEATKVPEITKAPEITKTEGNAAQTTAEATSAPGADNTGDAKTAEATATNKITTGIAAPATDKPGEDNGNTPPAPATDALAPDYLSDGYRKGEGKESYPNPALVDQAEIIGKALAAGGVTPTAINRMIRTLKDAKKLPFDAQQGALKKLIPLALKEKKTSHLLREVVEHNQAAVKNELDFAACIDHFKDISIFLAANGVKK